ncbi:hypothetical protein ABZW30_37220 [Kitasatospora sp. NPDC004669]
MRDTASDGDGQRRRSSMATVALGRAAPTAMQVSGVAQETLVN